MTLEIEDQAKHQEICHAISELMTNQLSMMISSINSDSTPHCSYSPFLNSKEPDGTAVYCFVSDLSAHTGNLRHTPLASLMFIEDENDSKSIFTRKRLTVDCSVTFIDRADHNWEPILTKMEDRHGETIKVLKGLSDFHLIKFVSKAGSYVQGFGEAYKFSGFDLSTLEHNRPDKK